MKTKTIKQIVEFNATPHDVYELLMDEKKHAAFTRHAARISRYGGGRFSAYDGWIVGENVELVPDKKIVQLWRANDEKWPKGHDSKVTFSFAKSKEGTKLTFTHEQVPEEWFDDLSSGWEEHYWALMKKMLKK